MSTNKKASEMPVMVNDQREFYLNKLAARMVGSYEKKVYPILFRFGLLDDEHIRKYLCCSTTEEIYKDAMSKNPDRVTNLEREAFFNDEDLWEAFRDNSSPVESPREEGFVFAPLPCNEPCKIVVAKALSVKNSRIHINQDILHEDCIVRPTEGQKELYALLSDFCEELAEKNYQKRPFLSLFDTVDGKVCPNIRGIMGVWSLRTEKRK